MASSGPASVRSWLDGWRSSWALIGGLGGVGSRVEQFEQIRRDREREGLSIRTLAARHGVHRRAVRQALASAVPPAKRAPVSRPAPKLGEYRAIIDAWLIADRVAPRT